MPVARLHAEMVEAGAGELADAFALEREDALPQSR
jgi:hypothetical protein